MPAQVWLVVAGAVGLVRYPALRQLRWTVVAAVLFGTMFVLAASSDEYWVNALTRPWWNDRWRLIGLCVVPLAVLAGHGLAELQRGAVLVATAAVRRSDPVHGPQRAPRTAAVAAAGVLVALSIGFSDGLYAARNVGQMAMSAPDGPVVSSLEVEAMRELARIVPPGQRVLNDRYDGSVWMYAIAGVLPVAGHYDARQVGPDASLLGNWFFQYPDNPDIRAAVERLGISYVMVGRGFVRAEDVRAPGLVGLEEAGWLEVVYREPGRRHLPDPVRRARPAVGRRGVIVRTCRRTRRHRPRRPRRRRRRSGRTGPGRGGGRGRGASRPARHSPRSGRRSCRSS